MGIGLHAMLLHHTTHTRANTTLLLLLLHPPEVAAQASSRLPLVAVVGFAACAPGPQP
jgi:hypothetical protein